MNGSYKLGQAFGIGIYIHWTFGLLVGWIVLSYGSAGAGFAQIVDALVLVGAVFGCVTLHELGHSLAARHYGINTRHITLLPIGGVAMLDRMPRNPRHELVIAVAGPAVNVAIIGVLLILSFLAGLGANLTGFNLSPGGGLISNLIVVNTILVLFNMIPAFPMDGGRVFRSLLSMKKGHLRATQIAATTGKTLAVALGIYGFLHNPVLMFTAVFVYYGAEAERRAALQHRFSEPESPPDFPREGPIPPPRNDTRQTSMNEPVWEIVREVPRGARRLHPKWRTYASK
jgi:Zn-dependent protease